MVGILENRIDDIQKLREENARLRSIFDQAVLSFESMSGEIHVLNERVKELTLENDKLKAELIKEKSKADKFASMLFGVKSEKVIFSGKEVNNNAVQEKETGKKTRGAKKGHIGNGRKIPTDLPIVEEILQENKCPKCGKERMQLDGLESVSWQVCMKKQYYLKKFIRKAYGPACDCDRRKILMAPPPVQLIPKGKYSEEIWTDFLISKYMGHMPIHRQLFEMTHAGIEIKPGMVFNGIKRIYSDFLRPLHEMLLTQLREEKHCHADETRWQMFLGDGRELWYMWGFRSERSSVFVLSHTRGSEVPLKTLFNLDLVDIDKLKHGTLITDEEKKKLNVDRYSAYKVLEKFGLVKLSYCWAHVRRDFIDLQKKFPNNIVLGKWADDWVFKIAELYKINSERTKYPQGSKSFLQYDKSLRDKLSVMKSESGETAPSKEQAAVMRSMQEHWGGLTLFFEHPELPMDNNLMENSIRPCALGRNNFLGNHSIWGGELAACMYSIIQTCLLNKINPREYLLHYFKVCAQNRDTMDSSKIRACLPYNLTQEIKSKMMVRKI